MNGKRLLLDTNAVVALLQGNQQVLNLTRDIEWIGISIISQIEFLCYRGLTDADLELFAAFLGRVQIVDLASTDQALITQAIRLRANGSLKLPDALIAAAALTRTADLVTADHRFETIAGLAVHSFQP